MGLVAKPKYSNDSVSIDFDPSSLFDDVISEGDSENVTTTYKCTCVCHHKLTILSLSIVVIIMMTYIIFKAPECIPSRPIVKVQSLKPTNLYRMVLRNERHARPALRLNLPVHQVIIAHTATESCSRHSQCVNRTKEIVEAHMYSSGFVDIAYNFLVGGDGAIYEGRGWDFIGDHTKGYNNDSICFALIGTFDHEAPPESQLNATKWIIQEGVRLNKIVEDYKLYGTRQLIESQSPGLALYEIIKQWPNWSPEIV